jgi:hypothetical protein
MKNSRGPEISHKSNKKWLSMSNTVGIFSRLRIQKYKLRTQLLVLHFAQYIMKIEKLKNNQPQEIQKLIDKAYRLGFNDAVQEYSKKITELEKENRKLKPRQSNQYTHAIPHTIDDNKE